MTNTTTLITTVIGIYLIGAFLLVKISFSIGFRLLKLGAVVGLLIFAQRFKWLINIGLLICALLFVYKILLNTRKP